MKGSYHKVIGYFAYVTPIELYCTGEACVIAGTYDGMKEYISEIKGGMRVSGKIRKTRFGAILKGLQMGAAYAFDEEAYSCFYPLAKQAGLPVLEADFEKQKAEGQRFLILQLA